MKKPTDYKCTYPHCKCESKKKCIAKENAETYWKEMQIRNSANDDSSGIKPN